MWKVFYVCVFLPDMDDEITVNWILGLFLIFNLFCDGKN